MLSFILNTGVEKRKMGEVERVKSKRDQEAGKSEMGVKGEEDCRER